MDTTQTQRERILQIGARPEFQAAVRDLLGAGAAASLEQHLQRCREGTFTVAVLGSQGVGKSSLINALRPGRPPLPSGERRTIEVIRIAADDGGIMLADTPGYGSTNPELELTTREFLSQVSAAIFVFSTTPPLLRPDLEFLRAAQTHCRRFFFVQTVNGETPDQIERARQYNLRQLGNGEQIYVVDLREGAQALADDLTEFIARGPYALSLRDALLAVLTAAWQVREALSKRRLQLEANLRRAEAQARTGPDPEPAAPLRLQERLAAFQTDLRLAERDWAQDLMSTAHRLEADLARFIALGHCTKAALEERAATLWQTACRELELALKAQGDQLTDHLRRQLKLVCSDQPPAAPRPDPDLSGALAPRAPGNTFTLTSPTALDLSRYADLFANGVQEASWSLAQQYFDQLGGWAGAEVAAAKQVCDERKQRTDRTAHDRLLAAKRLQQNLDELTARAHAHDALLAELQALCAEALV
ncbi:MAG TPA: GTPase [Symbiobacteriaceae bacterium]|nr:GTPase [Symbiobacteriaceae bacterium]